MPPAPLHTLVRQALFRFSTAEDAASVARFVSHYFPKPDEALYGIHELAINAIEHGNLGIGYALKSELLMAGVWADEIARRQRLPENARKYATLALRVTQDAVAVTIRDMGEGFDWQPYLDIAPQRLESPNGRGIATALRLSFSEIRFLGCGNTVTCSYRLGAAESGAGDA